MPFTVDCPTPTLVTMHGRLDLDHVRQTLPLYPDLPLVSISNHQREAVADVHARWGRHRLQRPRSAAATRRRHGPVATISRSSGGSTRRRVRQLAVEVARRCSRRLHVAAKIDPLDVHYYRSEIEPLFAANDVVFIGEVEEPNKPTFFASAAATLFPSDWPEPFGLVMIESMAAGTPVVALRRGSVPEIVIDGVTGFICDDVDEMVTAIGRLDELDPADCRRHAARFDDVAMCSAYERIYQSLWPTPPPIDAPTAPVDDGDPVVDRTPCGRAPGDEHADRKVGVGVRGGNSGGRGTLAMALRRHRHRPQGCRSARGRVAGRRPRAPSRHADGELVAYSELRRQRARRRRLPHAWTSAHEP